MKPISGGYSLAIAALIAGLVTAPVSAEISPPNCTKVGAKQSDTNFQYQCKLVAQKKKWVIVKPIITTPVIDNRSDVVMPSLSFGPLLWSDEFTGKAGSDLDPTAWASNLGNYSSTAITTNDPSLSTLDGSAQGILNIKTKKINDPSHYNGFCGGGKIFPILIWPGFVSESSNCSIWLNRSSD